MPSEDILHLIQEKLLYVLVAFDRVCREHGLTYFLDSGTALGAIRHGGFIPWDDDVDVGMPRKDYERFLIIGQEFLPEDIFIQTTQTEPNYKRNAAKLRLKGTVFQEANDLPYKYNGFFIDIFPFDNVPANQILAKGYIFISRFLFWIIRSWWSSNDSSSLVLRLTQRIIRLLPQKRIEILNALYVKHCRLYENKETGYITCFYWRMTQNKTYIFDTREMFPTTDILFERKLVRIMKSPDYYLSIMYGNYNELPPEDKRQYHLKYKVDFGINAEKKL